MGDFSTEGEFGGISNVDQGESFTSTMGPLWQPRESPISPDAQPVARENPYDVYRDRRDQALERLRNPPGFDNRAIFTWGEGVENLPFSGPELKGNNFLVGENFNTQDSPNKNKNKNNNPDNPVKEWNEVQREEKVIKVASEEDPDTYIKVKIAVKSLFATPDGMVIITWKQPQNNPGQPPSSSEDEDE